MPTAQPRRAPSGDDAHDMPDGLVRCVHCGISLTVDELMDHCLVCARPNAGNSFRNIERGWADGGGGSAAADIVGSLQIDTSLSRGTQQRGRHHDRRRRSSTKSSSSDDGEEEEDTDAHNAHDAPLSQSPPTMTSTSMGANANAYAQMPMPMPMPMLAHGLTSPRQLSPEHQPRAMEGWLWKLPLKEAARRKGRFSIPSWKKRYFALLVHEPMLIYMRKPEGPVRGHLRLDAHAAIEGQHRRASRPFSFGVRTAYAEIVLAGADGEVWRQWTSALTARVKRVRQDELDSSHNRNVRAAAGAAAEAAAASGCHFGPFGPHGAPQQQPAPRAYVSRELTAAIPMSLHKMQQPAGGDDIERESAEIAEGESKCESKCDSECESECESKRESERERESEGKRVPVPAPDAPMVVTTSFRDGRAPMTLTIPSSLSSMRSLLSAKGSRRHCLSSDAESCAGAGSPDSVAAEPPRALTIADFDLLKVLGRGGFGKVVLANLRRENEGGGAEHDQDQDDDGPQLFAIKVIDKYNTARQRQERHVKAERRVLQVLEHPFLVRMHAAFQDAKSLYLVMDFIGGGDLMYWIEKQPAGRFSEPCTRLASAEVLLALEHLHAHGVVYRDLKLDNVMLDRHGHVRLVDFGLAKEGVALLHTGARSVVGTPEFIAPEVLRSARGGGYGQSCDWWCFGLFISTMLTGESLFYSPDRAEMWEQIMDTHRPLDLPPGVLSAEATDIVELLLRRSISERLGCRAGGDGAVYGDGDAAQGAAAVKAHPFFSQHLDWDVVMRMGYEPELAPAADELHVDGQFDEQPVVSPPRHRPHPYAQLEHGCRYYSGFSFRRDGAADVSTAGGAMMSTA